MTEIIEQNIITKFLGLLNKNVMIYVKDEMNVSTEIELCKKLFDLGVSNIYLYNSNFDYDQIDDDECINPNVIDYVNIRPNVRLINQRVTFGITLLILLDDCICYEWMRIIPLVCINSNLVPHINLIR